jgi:hypothetical protein
MDDDRDLVEEAFRETRERPATDLAGRVSARLARERQARRTRLRAATWGLGAAAAAAVLAAVLLAGGWLAPAAPLALPATPTTLAHVPAGDTAAFLVPDGAAFRRVDWQGRSTGAFRPGPDAAGLRVSPDGTLAALPDAAGTGALVLSTAGGAAGHLDLFGVWSGDGEHAACGLDLAGAAPRLVVTDLRGAGAPRTVATPLTGTGLDARWTLIGCSVANDRLVAARLDRDDRAHTYRVTETALIQLSTGSLVGHVAQPESATVSDLVVSPDARYLAENDRQHQAADVRDLVNGQVVRHLPALVSAFSGDGRLALLAGDVFPTRPSAGSAIVDWRTGHRVWSDRSPAAVLAVRPGGGDFALVLAGQVERHLLVRPDGSALDLDASPRGPDQAAASPAGSIPGA